jgi:hypothetical protein
MEGHDQFFMRVHPFYGPGRDRGDSKGEDGSFKSLLFDSPMRGHAAGPTVLRSTFTDES